MHHRKQRGRGPCASASVNTATVVNPGFRRQTRQAYPKSRKVVSIPAPTRTSLTPSFTCSGPQTPYGPRASLVRVTVRQRHVSLYQNAEVGTTSSFNSSSDPVRAKTRRTKALKRPIKSRLRLSRQVPDSSQ